MPENYVYKQTFPIFRPVSIDLFLGSFPDPFERVERDKKKKEKKKRQRFA